MRPEKAHFAKDLRRQYQRLIFSIVCFINIGCASVHGEGLNPYTFTSGHDGEIVNLALIGYNYTNHSISSFTVDGNGGGPLRVSGVSSGGGGTTCCVRYVVGATKYIMSIRWQTGACIQQVKSITSQEYYDRTRYLFTEKDVKLTEITSLKPGYYEVHFYPDGHVETAITSQPSPPRIRLSEDRQESEIYKSCERKENG